MKITFIIAKQDGQHSHLHQLAQGRLFPPVALAAMVKMVANKARVQVLDERCSDVQHDQSANIVVIFTNGYNQQRTKELARQYQARGSFVVMTGPVLRADCLPADMSANCCFIGSGDECLQEFLNDYAKAKVKVLYRKGVRELGDEPLSMTFGDVTLRLAS